MLGSKVQETEAHAPLDLIKAATAIHKCLRILLLDFHICIVVIHATLIYVIVYNLAIAVQLNQQSVYLFTYTPS